MTSTASPLAVLAAAKQPAEEAAWLRRVTCLTAVTRGRGGLRCRASVVRRLSLREPLKFAAVQEHPLALLALIDSHPTALVLAHHAPALRAYQRVHDGSLSRSPN